MQVEQSDEACFLDSRLSSEVRSANSIGRSRSEAIFETLGNGLTCTARRSLLSSQELDDGIQILGFQFCFKTFGHERDA